MLQNVQNVQVSDTTGDAMKANVGFKNIYEKILNYKQFSTLIQGLGANNCTI